MNKLSKTQRLDAKRRIAAAFGKRRHAAINTDSQIGQTNFYGGDHMPKITRTDVLALIECAIYNWPQDEDSTGRVIEPPTFEEWAKSIISDIIKDIV